MSILLQVNGFYDIEILTWLYSPITYAWQGGARLGQQKMKLRSLQVTRKEYMEHGANICLRKFGRPSKVATTVDDEY